MYTYYFGIHYNLLAEEEMKTIAQVLKKAKDGDILTNGKLFWLMHRRPNSELIATPIKSKTNWDYNDKSFELWEECAIEKTAVIPGLRIL